MNKLSSSVPLMDKKKSDDYRGKSDQFVTVS